MNIKLSQKQATIILDETSRYSEVKDRSKEVNLEDLEKIIIDFSKIKHIFSAILNILVYIRKNFDGEITLIKMNDHIFEQLKTFKILSFFEVRRS